MHLFNLNIDTDIIIKLYIIGLLVFSVLWYRTALYLEGRVSLIKITESVFLGTLWMLSAFFLIIQWIIIIFLILPNKDWRRKTIFKYRK